MSDSPFPLEATPAEAQAAIAEEFAFFGDWSERYQYLIDLGRKLPAFPDAWKTEEHRLLGCQSMVWIVPSGDASKLDFAAASDSAIVSGLVFLALRVYSGRSAAEILATDPDYIGASAWPNTSHRPAATAWPRCSPSSANMPCTCRPGPA